MGGSWPEQLVIDRRALTVLEAIVRAAHPQEGCALLIGPIPTDHADHRWRITMAWPCLNVWEPEPERHRRFALDPREQLQAQKWARSRGLSVIGAALVGWLCAAVPSALDLELAMPPTVLLIASGLHQELRGWWLTETGDGRAAEPLPLASEDEARPGGLGD
jgi:[CysO sulfur-carrier protein]-S-L-cysteine hydrolase